MNKKSFGIGITIASVATLAIAFAASTFPSDKVILQKAKDAGLQAIPIGEELVSYQQKKIKDTGMAKGYSPLLTKEQIELGKKLYFDPRLSSSNLISCNTCHNLALAGTDVVPAAIGHKWSANPHHLNSPTTLNSAFNDVQFWDGRSSHLGDQAQGPIQSPAEMDAKPELVVQKITSIPEYIDEFKNAYGKNVKIDFKLIADTIALYELTLITPSRFDSFMHGNTNALSKKEKEGLNTFIEKGCFDCHTGINLGGSMQAFGITGEYKYLNVGDFRGNKDGLVKTPTLRNIMQTAPYFHNGQFWDVKDAIKEMGKIQVGTELTQQEIEDIAIFFKALDGKMPDVIYPVLPSISSKTTKPSF